MTERTFSIIKPDATRRNLTGKINAVIEDAGLRIVAQRRIRMSRAQAEKFYEVHKERPFYGELVEFMTSGPVVVQVLEGDNAVARYREVMGATNPAEAADGTIRKLYAENVGENSVHGSDSQENAALEIAQFFTDADIPAGRGQKQGGLATGDARARLSRADDPPENSLVELRFMQAQLADGVRQPLRVRSRTVHGREAAVGDGFGLVDVAPGEVGAGRSDLVVDVAHILDDERPRLAHASGKGVQPGLIEIAVGQHPRLHADLSDELEHLGGVGSLGHELFAGDAVLRLRLRVPAPVQPFGQRLDQPGPRAAVLHIADEKALAGETISRKPMPQLKVRRISWSATPPVLQPVEHRRQGPGVPVELGDQALGDGAGRVLDQAAAGDVGAALDQAGLGQGQHAPRT